MRMRKKAIDYYNYFLTIITSVLLLAPALSHGQVSIARDTISFDCRDSYAMRSRVDKFVIASDVDYTESEFFRARNEGCLPFVDIDFERTILVGFRYRGSNCDKGIEWATVIEHGDEYLIQFATFPPQVCRDSNFRIAWFILDKPPKHFELSFERVFKKQDAR